MFNKGRQAFGSSTTWHLRIIISLKIRKMSTFIVGQIVVL